MHTHDNKNTHALKNHNGFSLMELMVTLSIFAIITAITAPSFIRWKAERRIDSQADSVLSILRLSRAKAVRERANVVVSFNVATDTYTAFVDDGDDGGVANDRIRNGDERIIRNKTLSVDLTAAAFDTGALVVFGPRGLSSAGNVTLTENAKIRQISLTGAGSCEIN